MVRGEIRCRRHFCPISTCAKQDAQRRTDCAPYYGPDSPSSTVPQVPPLGGGEDSVSPDYQPELFPGFGKASSVRGEEIYLPEPDSHATWL